MRRCAILTILLCTVVIASDNLLLGIPGKADFIIDNDGYALGYSIRHGQALWVMYRMTRAEAMSKNTSRCSSFYAFCNISSSDYTNTGYDRGHLAPAADMAFSVRTMSDSFLMANISPQTPSFNRGIWRKLEEQIRQFAISEEDIYVITGPVLDDTCLTIAGKITVPRMYYKVICDMTPPMKMIGFILPNKGSTMPIQSFAVTVDAVEALTGLDFFNVLDNDVLEATMSIDAWKWNR